MARFTVLKLARPLTYTHSHHVVSILVLTTLRPLLLHASNKMHSPIPIPIPALLLILLTLPPSLVLPTIPFPTTVLLGNKSLGNALDHHVEPVDVERVEDEVGDHEDPGEEAADFVPAAVEFDWTASDSEQMSRRAERADER